MKDWLSDKRLHPIRKKLDIGERLDADDGITLYNSHDLIGIGKLADSVRQTRHGNTAFYVYNQHVNYTNVCTNFCLFCAYAKKEHEPGSFTLTIDQVKKMLTERLDEPVREFHVVGGLNPSLPFDYYLELLRTLREIRPGATIKAFTAVEIDHLAKITKRSIEDILAELKREGLAMMPGGGAEVMSDRIRQKLFPKKIDGSRWLNVMETAHGMGIVTNATMLYGHIETIEERVLHLIKLRELQDRTGGFSAFIPLAFHSKNTRLSDLPPTTAHDDLKTIAIARMMLDNFDHIKAYWVMIGEKLAQVALSFGADDLDGTIIEEKITHMAGAHSAKGLSRSQLETMIRSSGFTPVERDSFYKDVKGEQ